MLIKVKVNRYDISERFINIMSKIGNDFTYINGFENNDSVKHDYTICVNDEARGDHNTISMLAECVNISPNIWNNLDRWASGHKYILNWNSKITTDNSIYNPFVFWYIDWVEDMMDDNLKLNFNFAKKKNLLSIACRNKRPAAGIVKDLYSERLKFISIASDKMEENDFHIYGEGWDRFHKNFLGYVNKKSDTMKNYKFAVVFENQVDNDYFTNGYITEKIYDALRNYTIPIYYGPKSINELVPENCFIDYNKFDCDPNRVIEYISSIKENIYDRYLHNIDNYLKGELYKKAVHPETLYNNLKKICL